MDLSTLFSDMEIVLIAKAVDRYFFYLSSSKDTLTEEEEKTLDSLADISAVLNTLS